MKLSFGLVLLSSLLGALATTPEQVISDLKSITNQVATMDSNVKALKSPSDLTAAWGLHNSARDVVTSLHSATGNAKAAASKPISQAYQQDTLSAGDNLRGVIVTACNDIVAKKDIIAAFPVPGSTAIVRNDLVDMKTASQAYQGAFIDAASDGRRPAAVGIIDSINAAFDYAIAAYS